MFTIKLQTEAMAISQSQEKRFLPLGFLATVLNAITQREAQAMATLHQRSIPTLQLVGRYSVSSIKLL